MDEVFISLTEGWMISLVPPAGLMPRAGLMPQAGSMPRAGSMADRCFQKVRQFQTLSIDSAHVEPWSGLITMPGKGLEIE